MNILYWQAKHTNLFKYLSLGEICWQTRPLVVPPGEMESATDIPTVFWMGSSRGKVTLVYTTRWPPTLSVVDVKKHLERCIAAHCDLIFVVKLKNVCFSPGKTKGIWHQWTQLVMVRVRVMGWHASHICKSHLFYLPQLLPLEGQLKMFNSLGYIPNETLFFSVCTTYWSK